jgi:asparagine synthase (glutamine-hydrolysing)
MKHKPAYASGTYSFPSVGVYAGWVAHEGSFAARQSAHSAHPGAILLFSGECFQSGIHAEVPVLRASSIQGAEVDALLDLYAAEGDAFVGGLNGLFSGLLIDTTAKRALLFNDRYGMERIYYFEKDGTTFFASEAKALLNVLPELRSLDDRGVADFLAYGSTLGGRTLFRNVTLLPGGSLWRLDKTAPSVKSRYFDPEEWETQPGLGAEEFESEFERTFRRILPAYLTFQGRIGISLTGGLDTRMIMACIGHPETKPVCYTYGGLSGETLDARIGARVARACGFDHHVLRIGTDFLENYGDYVDRTVLVTDGCAGALGAHEIYFTALARELSPVRLTGNFGSEILRSMSTLKPVGLASDLIGKGFKEMITARVAEVSDEKAHPVTQAAFREIPWHLFGTLVAARSEVIFRTPYLDNELVKLAFRAPRGSRESPRSALKLISDTNPALGRMPTDRGLVWEDSRAMAILKRLFCGITFKLDYLHKEGLPHSLSPVDPLIGSLSSFGLLGLHKFLPYRVWFRRELAEYVADRLAAVRSHGSPYWDPKSLGTVAADHVRGRRNYLREIHAILTLEAVTRVLLAGAPEAQDTDLVGQHG